MKNRLVKYLAGWFVLMSLYGPQVYSAQYKDILIISGFEPILNGAGGEYVNRKFLDLQCLDQNSNVYDWRVDDTGLGEFEVELPGPNLYGTCKVRAVNSRMFAGDWSEEAMFSSVIPGVPGGLQLRIRQEIIISVETPNVQ